ncbi:hypothetical protein [Erwinia aphidicola]
MPIRPALGKVYDRLLRRYAAEKGFIYNQTWLQEAVYVIEKSNNAMSKSIITTSKRRESLIAAKEEMLQASMARMRQILLEYGSLEPFLGPDLSAEPELKSKR